MNEKNQTHPSLGAALLAVTDLLVQQRNVEGLKSLRGVVFALVRDDITNETVNIMEIGEYIDEATHGFTEGKTAEEIGTLSIRKLLESDRLQEF